MLGALVAVGFGGFNLGGLACGDAAPDAPQVLAGQRILRWGHGARHPGRHLRDRSRWQRGPARPGASTSTGPPAPGRRSIDPPTSSRSGRRTARSSFPFGTQRASWRAELGMDTRFETLAMELNAGDASVNLDGATLSRLTFNGNAVGNTRLDLSGATVERLDVAVNAADVAIRLPGGAGLQGAVEGNAASVDLCAPAGVGLRLARRRQHHRQQQLRRRRAWSGAAPRGRRPATRARPPGSSCARSAAPSATP